MRALLVFVADVLSSLGDLAARAADRLALPEDRHCRYAWNPAHRCVRRDGRPVRGDEPCYLEAQAQVYGDVSRRIGPIGSGSWR